MKIAIMAPLVTAIREPPPGGSQAFVTDLARGLAGRGHDVHVYAASGSRIEGVKLIDTGADPRALAATRYRAYGAADPDPDPDTDPHTDTATHAADEAFATAFAAVASSHYDVIHNHAFDAPAIRLATGLRPPVVHTLHLPPDKAMSAALNDAARQGGAKPLVAVVSRSQAAAWRQVGPVDAVLPPYPATRDIPWSATAGHGALFAGRLSPEKGAAQAIDIARDAGVPIRLFGDAYDARYARERIDPRRAWPGVDVHEAVPRTELWQAMARAAVVLCPARWDEPFGLAAAEAQACGTPVVAFSRGGLREVIVDGATGFLVPPDDVKAAAEAVSKAVGINRPACRRHAVDHLDLEQSLDAHERLYEQAAKNISR
jgi:glycosyltransferase involved in cell wall biosynthesis